MKQSEIHTYHYLSVEGSIRANGDRHLERAFNHLYCGHPDTYWQGSVDKALKNYKKADALKLDPIIEAMMKPLMDRLAIGMSDAIMYGTSYTKFNSDGTVSLIEAKDILK